MPLFILFCFFLNFLNRLSLIDRNKSVKQCQASVCGSALKSPSRPLAPAFIAHSLGADAAGGPRLSFYFLASSLPAHPAACVRACVCLCTTSPFLRIPTNFKRGKNKRRKQKRKSESCFLDIKQANTWVCSAHSASTKTFNPCTCAAATGLRLHATLLLESGLCIMRKVGRKRSQFKNPHSPSDDVPASVRQQTGPPDRSCLTTVCVCIRQGQRSKDGHPLLPGGC